MKSNKIKPKLRNDPQNVSNLKNNGYIEHIHKCKTEQLVRTMRAKIQVSIIIARRRILSKNLFRDKIITVFFLTI